ncbi:hypothetical protein K440DRAFT_553878 [Wilcoxina mikolae CBS 423.85]|nr:hypothetical protein K440DRAFT_553878 [Wilcoxina mikolae CBS 423.85]
MLGRLFSSASSTAGTSPNGTRPSTSYALESDELHTRNLLYPDTSSVASSFHSSYSLSQSHSSAGSSFSLGGDIDLEPSRDARVIIAQDSTNSEHKVVLYDSKPSHGAASPSDEGPTSPTLGTSSYCRPRRRNQQYTAQHAVSSDDDVKMFTDCMFGVAPLSYKGPSTKVHVLPAVDDRRTPSTTNSPASSRRGSLRDDRTTAPTHHQLHHSSKPQPHIPHPAREKRKSVLITRLFSVVIPPCPTPAVVDGGRNIPQPSGSGEHTATPTSSVGSTSGFPFPKIGGQTTPSSTAKLIRPSKSSMYAIGLIISLPPAAGSSASAFPTRCCYHKPFLTYDSDFPHRHEFCCPTPPSFDDDYSALPPGSLKTECAADDLHSTASVNDGRMDLVTNHWDVIIRALSDLQRVAQARILENLTTARLASPQPVVPTQMNGIKYLNNRCELRKMALMRDDIVRAEVERLRWRVVTGIRTPRVVVGQGRWDRWREEAKWANHRFGGRDMNFFFLTLLTAFLGHHTEWLDVLGPEPYKRRHRQQVKARPNPEENAIPCRTVLLSNDRIAARRLIYLLSTFLPAQSHQTLDALPPSSGTSSVNYLSQSPPSFNAAGTTSTPGSRYGSLRRKARKKPSKLNVAVSSENEADDTEELAGWTIPAGSCNSSSTGSVLLGPGMRKPESIGTLTTMPSSATCVASAPAGSRAMVRPDSSGSAASVNLMSTLKRTGTANTSMDSSAWGSFLSFWSTSPKSRSSTATSEESMQSMLPDEDDETAPPKKALEDEDPLDVGEMLDDNHPPPFSPILSVGSYPLMEQISVDDVDGAINVPLDLTFPNFTSPLSSPPQTSWTMPSIHSGLNPNRSFLPPPPPPPSEDDSVCSVAGWIDDERFHPDFRLQAVKPYPEVEADIKRAMRMEPTPSSTSVTPWSESPTADKWITVSEVLIADTKRLQLKRLRLRRRVKRTSMPTPHQHHYQRYLQPEGVITPGEEEDDQEEEVMEEEIVCDVDDILATAIEQVIAAEEDGACGCKCAILGALQKVVGEVVSGEMGERWGGNVLTEGVSKWISGVEEAN